MRIADDAEAAARVKDVRGAASTDTRGNRRAPPAAGRALSLCADGMLTLASRCSFKSGHSTVSAH